MRAVLPVVFIAGCGRFSFDPHDSIADGPPSDSSPSACPVGFVSIPALVQIGVPAFCVAKYEMASVSGEPVSQPGMVPVHTINQEKAREGCVLLGSGYALVTNLEAMAIARDIETVGANWSTGTRDSGALARGHSDYSPTAPLPASADDGDPCYLTANVCSATVWADQRRTHLLSNGEVIWDVSGNVAEWVDWNVLTDKASGGAGGPVEVNLPSPTAAMPAASFKSANEALTSADGIGLYSPGNDGVGGAAHRGGSYYASSNAGIYALTLISDPDLDASGFTDSGFRCAFHP